MSAIGNKHGALGGDNGFLGKASAAEVANADGRGFHQDFEHGVIYWHPDLGAFEVHGAILDRWMAMGKEASSLGYPLTDESATPDGVGRYSHFQHGSIYWTPSSGAHDVPQRVRERWAKLGWERGFLGYPIEDPRIQVRGRAQVEVSRFRGGRIEWEAATNRLQTFHEPSGSSPNFIVRVRAVRVRDTGGGRTTAISVSDVQQWLQRANEVFTTAGIHFDYDNRLIDISNTDVNNLSGVEDSFWTSARDTLNAIAAQERAIVLAFRHGAGLNPTGGGFSWWDYDFVVLPGFATTVCAVQNLGLAAHELGHYFGLPHTHAGRFATVADAAGFFLSRSADPAVFDGDRSIVSDTSPDPFIDALQCDVSRDSVALAGTPFALARDNAMSYWHSPTAQAFTFDQIRRIREILVERRRRIPLEVRQIDSPFDFAVSPYPVPRNRVVRVTVTATEIETGLPVAGKVKVDGRVVGDLNVAFSHIFKGKRRRVQGEWEVFYPTVVAEVPGYRGIAIDFGFPG